MRNLSVGQDASGNGWRVRYEGWSLPSLVTTQQCSLAFPPTIVWELLLSNDGTLTLCTGTMVNVAGISAISDGSSDLFIQKFILTTLGIDLLKKEHITKRYMDTVTSLGVMDDGKGLDYFIPTHTQSVINDLPENFKSGYVGLVIGASYFNKKLPFEKLSTLIASIHLPIVLIGGPDDKEVGVALQESFGGRVFNACGTYRINESALFVKHAQYIISHDTGFLHIACAFNKPTVTIWGATTPALQFSALYPTNSDSPRFDAIVPNLKCQPCAKQGSNHCPKGHFNCMQLQNTDLIAAKVNG
jgi:heptosyltransferase-2